LELPFGIDLLQKIAESRADHRPDDLLRCFLSLCRPLLHIKTGGFWLSEFEPAAILWHSQRDSFCFHARLECFDKNKSSEIMQAIVELFQRQLTDRPHLKNRAQMAKIELCDLEDFVHNLQACLEDCLLERTQDRQSLLEELLEIEVLHRASVHGLKGKFGIFRRYGTDSNRLLETFFRSQNVEDVIQKLESMSELILQLCERRSIRRFAVFDVVLSLNLDSIISRIRKLASEWLPSRHDPQFVEFLKQQHQHFEKLSDSLGHFLHRHSLSLDLFLQQFIDKFVEKDRLHLIGTSGAMSTKLALVSPEEMIRDLLIILENLCHNALEAGANSIEILVIRTEASWVNLEICDNGPGFSEAVLSEINARDGIRFASTGTGLPTSQALCESLGGKFSVQSPSGNGAKITLSLPCFIA
jgi:signal transduction histidine kinase